MNEAQRKELIRQTFDTVAAGYDRPALRFFRDSATHLVEQLQLVGDEHVLDVATGRGANRSRKRPADSHDCQQSLTARTR